MNTRVVVLLIAITSFSCIHAFAQEDQPPANPMMGNQGPGNREEAKTPLRDRFFFGGSLGLDVFGGGVYIDVSPLVGYKVTKKFHVGVGFTYSYLKSEVQFTTSPQIYDYHTHNYGGRVFARYYVWENAFAHVEYEYLNIGYPALISTNEITVLRDNINNTYVGGGYAQPIGPNAAIVLMLLYNLTEDPYSPDPNPIIRIGITAGF